MSNALWFIKKDEPTPYCAVDLNRLVCNYKQLDRMAQNPYGKLLPFRIATKSIRSPQFIEWIFQHCPRFGNRLMAYRVREALFLLKSLPQCDVLVAYPSLERTELEEVCRYLKEYPKTKLTLMVSSKNHVELLSLLARENQITIRVCIDVSVKTFGVFGASRTAIETPGQLESFILLLLRHPSLKLVGLMGYEAQIAGLPDNTPDQFFRNHTIGFLKKQSIKKIHALRQKYLDVYRKVFKNELEFFNGGGSGSLDTSAKDQALTELTVGSGLICPRQFLYYHNLREKIQPAVFFALRVTTQIDANRFQCTSGGFIASGVPQDKSKLPLVVYPFDTDFDKQEGCNETVSMVRAPKHKLREGDLVYCIHGKAGELFERFPEIIAIHDAKVIGRFPTYVGEGKFFQ